MKSIRPRHFIQQSNVRLNLSRDNLQVTEEQIVVNSYFITAKVKPELFVYESNLSDALGSINDWLKLSYDFHGNNVGHSQL